MSAGARRALEEVRERVCRYGVEIVALMGFVAAVVACAHDVPPAPGARETPANTSGALPTASGVVPTATATASGVVPTATASGVVPTTAASGIVPTATASGVVPTATASGVVPTAASGVVPTASSGAERRLGPTAVASVALAASGPSTTAAGAQSAVAPPRALAGPSVVRRRGPVASGESYEASLETTGDYAVGAPSAVLLSLSAKPPFKCNTQYPYKFTLDAPPSGVSYPGAVARGMQVDGKHASMSVPFTASHAGSYLVGGVLSFSTCTAERCLVDKARLSVLVDVN